MSGAAYYMARHEIVAAIGRDAAAKLIESFGGTKFYVCRKPGPEHKLVAVIGTEATEKLADYVATGIGGMVVEIPGCGSTIHNERLSRLRDLVERGEMTEAQIARELGVTGRTVRRMRARVREQDALA